MMHIPVSPLDEPIYTVYLRVYEAHMEYDFLCKAGEQTEILPTGTLPSFKSQVGNFNKEYPKVDLHFHTTLVLGDSIMNKHEVNISASDKAQIHSDFMMANSIKDSIMKIHASNTLQKSGELKELLVELSIAVQKMTEHLSEKDRNDVDEDFTKLVEQAMKENPRQKWWAVSVEGLSKAATKLGTIGLPVLDLIEKIVSILVKKA